MDATMRRFFEAAGCRTQIELAAFLDIRQSSVSDAKKRRVIPSEWLITLLRQKNINPYWVMTGTGPRFLLPADDPEESGPCRQDKRSALGRFSTKELAEEVARRVAALL